MIAGLSHPDDSVLHRQWLGSMTASGDPTNGDTYSAGISMGPFTLTRLQQDTLNDKLQILQVNDLRMDFLTSQWPSPWLQVSPLMLGDPNAQLCAVDIIVGSIQITEQLEFIRELMERVPSEPFPDRRARLPSILSPVPRIIFGLRTAELSARLISVSEDVPFALDIQTDGLVLSFDSIYHSLVDSSLDLDHFGVRLDFNIHGSLDPLFVSVCSNPTIRERHQQSKQHSPDRDPVCATVLSMEAIQLRGNGNALGDVVDGPFSAVTIDVSSIFSDIHCSIEAISIELWQPDVIKALSHTITNINGRRPKDSSHESYLLDSLPFGVAASLSVGRVMVFITSPELAPDDELNIFRGVACHTGFSLSYCAIHTKHARRIQSVLNRAQRRLQLLLPAEQIAKAVSASNAPSTTTDRVFFQVVFWDLALRDAISTAFAADDPYGTGDTDEYLRSHEWLHVGAAEAEIILSGQRTNGQALLGSKDSCLIHATAGNIRATLHLAQVYNLLLASRTLKSIIPTKTSRENDISIQHLSTLSVECRVTIKKIQVLWTFPIRSKLFMRATNVHCSFSSGTDIVVQWDDILLAVNVVVRRDETPKEQWEELVRLHRWQVNIRRQLKPTRFLLLGNGGRLQIPFDYVLADLILDFNVTLKSIRHLITMVSDGRFRQPSSPSVEGPKHMPHIDIRLRCLTLEAMDEDLEANLGLIWRASADAARVRTERETAFQAKVATILQTMPSSAVTEDLLSDYQFSPNHTVSIAEARERLDHVHSVSWKSAFAKAKSQQESRETASSERCVGTLKRPRPLERDIVAVNTPRSSPPMCRLLLDNMMLSLSPPSFPLDRIPDFLFVEGNGLPRDTEFTLLIPVHVKLASSSLRLSFRDYPVPLLNVPPSSTKAANVFHFEGDVVIAEEVGTSRSVQWIDCAIVAPHSGVHGASSLSIQIPKTIMPVKVYAQPNIKVTTDGVTDFAWGVSYSPATQDFMRIIDTLSHAPRDSSPAIGFWDKVRDAVKSNFDNSLMLL